MTSPHIDRHPSAASPAQAVTQERDERFEDWFDAEVGGNLKPGELPSSVYQRSRQAWGAALASTPPAPQGPRCIVCGADPGKPCVSTIGNLMPFKHAQGVAASTPPATAEQPNTESGHSGAAVPEHIAKDVERCESADRWNDGVPFKSRWERKLYENGFSAGWDQHREWAKEAAPSRQDGSDERTAGLLQECREALANGAGSYGRPEWHALVARIDAAQKEQQQ